MQFARLEILNGAVQERLSIALGSDTEIVRGEIEAKRAELWEVNQGESYLVTRIEHDELVVVCFEGRNLKQVCAHLRVAARAKDLTTVRFHTKRTSLARLIKDYEPELSEYIYRIKV